ncbi:MAG: hypothetical protein RMM31_10980 [Anaerolineae bacterium]|nr:hypothetical protein [Thermoflexales bacterium]MDW8396753.1 hypothetical protein [Anaerolineae bacterium]
MSTAQATSQQPLPVRQVNWRDQWSAALAIVVTVAALLAGLALRASVESRVRTYSNPSGLSFQYPDGWQIDAREADLGLIRVRYMAAAEYPTTFELRWIAVDPAMEDVDALSFAANQLAINRGREHLAFKVLDVQSRQTIKGLPASTTSYVLVEDSSGLMRQNLPAVVLGEDIGVRKGERVYIFSWLASEGNRAQTEAAFRAFVESAKLP